MNKWIYSAVLLISVAASAQTRAEAPKTYLVDGELLARLSEQPNSTLVKRAIAEADSAIHAGPFTVTSKTQLPPSGDKHDYMSLAPYFWPNPATPNHLPYVRHDGEHNPQADSIPDHTNIFKMEDAVHALAVGFELTGREEYAARATLLIRTWFLDPQTRMNPSLQFAQAVLGVNDGRGTGILEARGLPYVTDAIAMLQNSHSWTKADEAAIESWFKDYYLWLTTSANGRDEAKAKNNHGSWYDFQAAGIALFLGKQADARAILMEVRTKRIAVQIEADGKQPLELARTKSFSYCVFNLDALTKLADMGDRVGVDIWKYQTPNGGSIRAALDFLTPFALNGAHWDYQDVTGFDGDALRIPLLREAVQFRNAKYLDAADRLKGKDTFEFLMLHSEFKPNANIGE
jgi:hypothetical protein